jgi:deoxyribodipyrimidine photo-lyase
MKLPNPTSGNEVAWVTEHLGHVCSDIPARSTRFTGTQAAADALFESFDVRGYAARRNEVWPVTKRGASGLSPYIRHGLLSLGQMWSAVGGSGRDTEKFRDELLWQEYARHVYARLGRGNEMELRYEAPGTTPAHDPWDRTMACVDLAMTELETDGWLVNQTRMWMASQWAVRHGAAWREGEDRFFTHLLDGSRAANRLGWQWTIGAGTGKPYGFSKWQVDKRAPGLCDGCVHRRQCPIDAWPATNDPVPVESDPRLRHDPDPQRTGGPSHTETSGTAEAVWLTAESLGDADPALQQHSSLPVIFVFDEPLLARLQLSGKRLVFLTERLSELADERELSVHLGDVVTELDGATLATTFAPVPGWRRLSRQLNIVETHPWPWLVRPTVGSISSYSAWNTRRPTR